MFTLLHWVEGPDLTRSESKKWRVHSILPLSWLHHGCHLLHFPFAIAQLHAQNLILVSSPWKVSITALNRLIFLGPFGSFDFANTQPNSFSHVVITSPSAGCSSSSGGQSQISELTVTLQNSTIVANFTFSFNDTSIYNNNTLEYQCGSNITYLYNLKLTIVNTTSNSTLDVNFKNPVLNWEADVQSSYACPSVLFVFSNSSVVVGISGVQVQAFAKTCSFSPGSSHEILLRYASAGVARFFFQHHCMTDLCSGFKLILRCCNSREQQ